MLRFLRRQHGICASINSVKLTARFHMLEVVFPIILSRLVNHAVDATFFQCFLRRKGQYS